MLFTLNGHNMFDVSSLIQKSLRRCDIEYASYAAHEMMYKFRSYLWKRLLVVSAEDCFDLVSGRVLQLQKKDIAQGDFNNSSFISQAVGLLCMTRKNRDADYFICNHLHSGDKMNFPTSCDLLVTRHHHGLRQLITFLKERIASCKYEEVGYIANEILSWYKPVFWSTMIDIAKSFGSEMVVREFLALKEIAFVQSRKPGDGALYASKAIVTLFRLAQYNSDSIFKAANPIPSLDVKKYSTARMLPEYTYDCHTRKGKAKGLTFDDFVKTEHDALVPFVPGIFDHCGWENFKKLKAGGWNDNFNPPLFPKDIQTCINQGKLPNTLFD